MPIHLSCQKVFLLMSHEAFKPTRQILNYTLYVTPVSAEDPRGFGNYRYRGNAIDTVLCTHYLSSS